MARMTGATGGRYTPSWLKNAGSARTARTSGGNSGGGNMAGVSGSTGKKSSLPEWYTNEYAQYNSPASQAQAARDVAQARAGGGPYQWRDEYAQFMNQANREMAARQVAEAGGRYTPAWLPTGSFMAGGGNLVRTRTGVMDISPQGKAARERGYANYDAAMRGNREQTFNDFNMPNDRDLGLLDLGQQLGDYQRSLIALNQPAADMGGGPDWWGNYRRGGGGYGGSYGGYVPSWYTGLFQLNANR